MAFEEQQRGFWAGNVATGPMTLFLVTLFDLLPKSDRKTPLPPTQLTEEVSHSRKWTMPLHYLFGSGAGAVYSVTAGKIDAPPVARGLVFGTGVWLASYFGWIPLFGLKASGFKQSSSRNAMMLGAHLVWGVALALVFDRLQKEGRQTVGV